MSYMFILEYQTTSMAKKKILKITIILKLTAPVIKLSSHLSQNAGMFGSQG